ncbi:MAG: GIY-YIG nuclease family protein [Bacteroidota bacterium]|nr:GIY-YIG nuclease family protein [Bacteroidota bacterium]
MKKGHHYFVYILACSDGSYYTGVTNNLERRLWQHETGFNAGCYTYKRRPVELKYAIHLTDIRQAIAWEKQIKGWSRKKKEALFKEDWEEIKKLARNYTEYPRGSGSEE